MATLTKQEYESLYPVLSQSVPYEQYMTTQNNQSNLMGQDYLRSQTPQPNMFDNVATPMTGMTQGILNYLGMGETPIDNPVLRPGMQPERQVVTDMKTGQASERNIKLSPTIGASVPEYNYGGTPDMSLGGLGRQERDIVRFGESDLNTKGTQYQKEQIDKGVKPRDIRFGPEHFKTDAFIREGNVEIVDGQIRNKATGGILPQGYQLDSTGQNIVNISDPASRFESVQPGPGAPATFGGQVLSQEVADYLATLGVGGPGTANAQQKAIEDAAKATAFRNEMADYLSLGYLMFGGGLLGNQSNVSPYFGASAPRGQPGTRITEVPLYSLYNQNRRRGLFG